MARFYAASAVTGCKVLPTSDYETTVKGALGWARNMGCDVVVINTLNDLPVAIVSPSGETRQA